MTTFSLASSTGLHSFVTESHFLALDHCIISLSPVVSYVPRQYSRLFLSRLPECSVTTPSFENVTVSFELYSFEIQVPTIGLVFLSSSDEQLENENTKPANASIKNKYFFIIVKLKRSIMGAKVSNLSRRSNIFSLFFIQRLVVGVAGSSRPCLRRSRLLSRPCLGRGPRNSISKNRPKQLAKAFRTVPCCGGRTRTCDLQVMSLASYQLLHSAILTLHVVNERCGRSPKCVCKDRAFRRDSQGIDALFAGFNTKLTVSAAQSGRDSGWGRVAKGWGGRCFGRPHQAREPVGEGLRTRGYRRRGDGRAPRRSLHIGRRVCRVFARNICSFQRIVLILR